MARVQPLVRPVRRRAFGEMAKAPPPESSPAEQIVAAARRHFFGHGFRGVTMDDVASLLGMSKRTLYQHFRSKEELIAATLQHKLTQLDLDLARVLSGADDGFHEQLKRLLRCSQSHLAEITPAFARDLERDAPQLFAGVQQRRREVITRHFEGLFQRGQRSGMVRRDLPLGLVLEVLLGAVQSMITPARLADPAFDAAAAYGVIIRLVLEGLLTSRGRDSI